MTTTSDGATIDPASLKRALNDLLALERKKDEINATVKAQIDALVAQGYDRTVLRRTLTELKREPEARETESNRRATLDMYLDACE